MSSEQNNVSHLNRDVRREHGSTSEAHRPQRSFTPQPAAPRKFIAKGHDAQLMDAQMGKFPTKIRLSGGSIVDGIITKRDKFTITLKHTSGDFIDQDEIFYKHAIESVMITRPAL